jgi:branched-chain amino acid aminotransferase group I
MEEIIYLNGDLIPRSQAKISPFDHGFLYGYGLFETMRSYGGTIFGLDRHLIRLQRAAETLNIAAGLAAFDLEKACCHVLEANKLTDARLRLTVTAGEGDIIPNSDSCKAITLFIAAKKLVPTPPEIYRRGYSAILSSYRRNSRSPLSRLKSTSYLESVLARQEASSAGADEVVLLNETGFISEGSSTNIFLVNGETLITPSIESGALPGITREVVLELAESTGIKAAVKQVEPGDLHSATEAFLTNSVIEIMPLTRLENKPVGSGKPGPVTQQLMSSYRELISRKPGR